MSIELTKLLQKKCDKFGEQFKASAIAEMIVQFYHPEAVMEGGDLPAQLGHEAIQVIFEEANEFYSEIIIELEPVTRIGDVAFGNFTNRNPILGGGRDIHRGQMIWCKVGDDWLVVRDFFFTECDPLSPLPLYRNTEDKHSLRRSERL